jgi:hypothetical protein
MRIRSSSKVFLLKYMPDKPRPSGAPSIPSGQPYPIVTKKELNLWSTKTVSCKPSLTAACQVYGAADCGYRRIYTARMGNGPRAPATTARSGYSGATIHGGRGANRMRRAARGYESAKSMQA